MVVRVCVKTSGEIIGLPAKKLPLKTTLPRLAEAPQHSAAITTNKYPRHGCAWLVAGPRESAGSSLVDLVGKHTVQLLRVETDHNGVTDNNRGCGAAVVFADQLKNRLLVHADVLYFEMNSSRREEGLCRIARRSAGLTEYNNFFLVHEYSSQFCAEFFFV